MIRVYVMYPYSEGCRFDFEYYENVHMPLCHRLLASHGLTGTFVGRGKDGGGPGVPPEYVCVGGMEFDSVKDYHRGVKAHGAELQADFPKYTDITPILVVSETNNTAVEQSGSKAG